MKKEDILLLLLAIFLLLAAILTIYFGKGRSRHGYGALFPQPTPNFYLTDQAEHRPV